MTALSANERIELENGGFATVLGSPVKVGEPLILGSGVNGETYMVEIDGERYLLKWFTNETLFKNDSLRDSLKLKTDMFAKNPSSIPQNLIWPLWVTRTIKDQTGNESYGYVMNLFNGRFTFFEKYLIGYRIVGRGDARRKVPLHFRDAETKLIAAINVCNAIDELIGMGQYHQNFNHDSILLDLDNGDVLLCDPESISDVDMGNYYPCHEYAAPERILTGKAPDELTERHVLATLLYTLLICADPFKGKKVHEYNGAYSRMIRELYGSDPVFCWDPDDDSNRPVEGVDTNSLMLWKCYPSYVRDLFVRAFTIGVEQPAMRPTPKEWRDALSRAMTSCFVCPRCGKWKILDDDDASENTVTCCGVDYPIMDIRTPHSVMPLVAYPGKKLRRISISESETETTEVVAEFIENPKHPGVIGIKKLANDEWRAEGIDFEKPVRVTGIPPIQMGTVEDCGKTESIILERRTV